MEDNAIQVSRIYKIDGDTKLKAFVDVAIGDFVIKGLKILQGKKGLFLAMPQEQGKDGKWYNIFFPATKEAHQNLADLVLAAYQE